MCYAPSTARRRGCLGLRGWECGEQVRRRDGRAVGAPRARVDLALCAFDRAAKSVPRATRGGGWGAGPTEGWPGGEGRPASSLCSSGGLWPAGERAERWAPRGRALTWRYAPSTARRRAFLGLRGLECGEQVRRRDGRAVGAPRARVDLALCAFDRAAESVPRAARGGGGGGG